MADRKSQGTPITGSKYDRKKAPLERSPRTAQLGTPPQRVPQTYPTNIGTSSKSPQQAVKPIGVGTSLKSPQSTQVKFIGVDTSLKSSQSTQIASSLSNQFNPLKPQDFSPGAITHSLVKSQCSSYFSRGFIKYCFLEPSFLKPEFFDHPHKLADKLVPRSHDRIDPGNHKTQEFYEFVLIDTKSIDLFEIPDKNDPTRVVSMKMKIKKILSVEQWGNPEKYREFPVEYSPQYYNYWDYCDAWYKMILKQNQNYSLSWFCYFDKSLSTKVPLWFLHWWENFGLSTEIFPDCVKTCFEFWKENVKIPESWLKVSLLFIFSKYFNLTWILSLDYQIREKRVGIFEVPQFGRRIRIKWWSSMNTDQFTINNMEKWLSGHPKLSTKAQQPPASNQTDLNILRASLQRRLENAKTRAEFDSIMADYSSPPPSVAGPSGLSFNLLKDSQEEKLSPVNQDDYYGIFSSIDTHGSLCLENYACRRKRPEQEMQMAEAGKSKVSFFKSKRFRQGSV